MSDLIDRLDALDAVNDCGICIQKILDIPSAEPERKKGKWIWADGVRCSRCYYKLQTTGIPRYCPNCGSYNGGE